ncbi:MULTISPECIES: hypothetical protein [Streptomyces]|uniref:hypothetical protein n=1 Tax=Streptomyces TaxID=1883 RepID=UPI002061CBF7|nr:MULTISPECIES: hypothetical protein [Streptomyces]UPT46826.1 hypothetical protein MWG59_38980 [Streptomyces sp. WAC00303]WIY80943.1 hypothetical protein QPM16_38610 [Streptomyces anulatus]
MASIFGRRLLLGLLASALVIPAAMLGVANADSGNTAKVSSVAESGMPLIVENFAYPGAAKIQEETGAILKHGDGKMLFTACDGTEDILVMTREGSRNVCFDVKAKPAYLALELPKAYGIWTSADPVKATIRAGDGATAVVNAVANDFTGFGEATPESESSALIELRIT